MDDQTPEQLNDADFRPTWFLAARYNISEKALHEAMRKGRIRFKDVLTDGGTYQKHPLESDVRVYVEKDRLAALGWISQAKLKQRLGVSINIVYEFANYLAIEHPNLIAKTVGSIAISPDGAALFKPWAKARLAAQRERRKGSRQIPGSKSDLARQRKAAFAAQPDNWTKPLPVAKTNPTPLGHVAITDTDVAETARIMDA